MKLLGERDTEKLLTEDYVVMTNDERRNGWKK